MVSGKSIEMDCNGLLVQEAAFLHCEGTGVWNSLCFCESSRPLTRVMAFGKKEILETDARQTESSTSAFFIAGSPQCEPSTHVWELSEHFTPTALHPTLQLTVDRHRSKVVESLQIYPAVYDATILLYNSFHQAPEPELFAEPSELSTRRLKCLVFLSVIFQESVYSSVSALGGSFSIDPHNSLR
ncbi:hypothetical protein BDV34DRAFT_202870 [Aspergillus parasiticus]|uniref:Uncharacterized protein n=1 Tax=Aspergillus parasiticus TaxID=5067 RepID=A0A5N6D862_ASPPA|nr:hypothetical protein BDV34DRAFT_202870 [Aspergillus parasiticus]